MEKIAWTDDKFSVGNPQIDDQHKQLIKHINRLIALQKQRGNKKQQVKILTDLENYIEQHLVFEEALLRERGYPAHEEHAQLHSQYMIEVEMWGLMVENEDPNLLKKMCSFLNLWLTEHILGEDMKFSKYVK